MVLYSVNQNNSRNERWKLYKGKLEGIQKDMQKEIHVRNTEREGTVLKTSETFLFLFLLGF
jgi:hypothetical protein